MELFPAKNRGVQYETAAQLLGVTAKDAGNPKANDEAKKLATNWKDKAAKYDTDAGEIEAHARDLENEAKQFQKEAQARLDEVAKQQHEAVDKQKKRQTNKATRVTKSGWRKAINSITRGTATICRNSVSNSPWCFARSRC